MHKNQHGFTLLELSAVIVIIALLIGGIMVGTNLQKSARLQAVVADVNRYKNAVKLFQEKYKYLPGDMPNASSYWSAATNGNGDTFIGDSTNTPLAVTTNPTEQLLAWQHLGYASLIEGGYTGSGSLTPRVNIPGSTLRTNNGFTLFYARPSVTSGTGTFTAAYNHIIVYGDTLGLANTKPAYQAGLTGEDALTLDTKMDDGMPGTGNVLSYTNGAGPTTSCANGATAAATYVTTSSTLTCSLIFITGF